jgi:4-amino-4-deoxy-L-arabinose transferase-like glycosyltransferase
LVEQAQPGIETAGGTAAAAVLGPKWWLELLGRIPGVIWCITGLWVVLLLGASVVWPMTYGYDEPHHIDMAYDYAYHPLRFYGPAQLHVTYADDAMQHLLPGYPPSKSLADWPIAPRDKRPTFLQLGGPKLTSGGQPNQMDEHPPLYYWMEAVVLRLPGVSHLAWDLQVWLMRLLSVALVAPLPIFGWATARKLTTPAGAEPGVAEWTAVLAAALPLTCASLIRDGSAVTNDTLLVSLTTVLVYLIARVLRGDRSARTATLVAVTLAAALWTKGTALAYPPVVFIAYLVGASGRGVLERLKSALRPLVLVAGGCVLGGLWWLRNVIDYGTVQPSGFGSAYTRIVYGTPDHSGSIIRWAPTFVVEFVGRIWGGMGILDRPSIGPFVEYGWPVLVGAAVLVAVLSKGQPGDRLRAWVLAAFPVAVFLIVAEGSYSTNKEWSGIVAAAQGRYIYPCFTALSALAILGLQRVVKGKSTAWLPMLALVAGLVTNAAAWLIILRSWYKPQGASSTIGGLHQSISSLLRWSPLPDAMTVLLVVVLPVTAAVGTLIVCLRRTRELTEHQPGASGSTVAAPSIGITPSG